MSSPPSPSGVCQEKSGFLFKHDCPYPADQTCQRCHKPICSRHTRYQEELVVCIRCSRRPAAGAGPQPADRTGRHYYDDSYDYGHRHYSGYGHYHTGMWGAWWYGSHRHYDTNDLTEADAVNLAAEGDEAFEQDLGAS